MAAEYFLGKGFKNLAFFGIHGLDWSEERRKSFKRSVQESKADFYEYLLSGDEADVLSHNFDELENWLKGLPKPTGLLCCNDDFGQILINSCSNGGIKVPHEIAVLGVDNDELLCNITYPNLSSIARNHFKTANTICITLNRMMDGIRDQEAIIYTEALEVIERTSTDTEAARDAGVSKAAGFISKNLHHPLKASDVAEYTGLSIKALNRKFKALNGNTVSEEIQLRKLAKFKKLLTANFSVKQIALELGFTDISHVSRWFVNQEGITPTEWKRKFSI
nr:substrate-binding domain-containing protein [Pedobacter xinjiangensis]